MAGVTCFSSSPKPSKSCQSLLLKLKKGQDVLKKSIESINPPAEMAAASRRLLCKRRMESRCRDALTINLDRVSNFPRKRARLQQLTPEYEVSVVLRSSLVSGAATCRLQLTSAAANQLFI